MNDAIAAIALGRRIDLTREPDFVAGGVEVRPTACEVIAGGARVKLQPRVMQVLVALARTGGEPVSRESLTDVCWGQLAVSDDALNRCVQRLRRLAEKEAKGAFIIETIPRLGYRLAIVQPTGVGVAAPAPRVRHTWRTWPVVVAGLIVVGALAAAGGWRLGLDHAAGALVGRRVRNARLHSVARGPPGALAGRHDVGLFNRADTDERTPRPETPAERGVDFDQSRPR